MSHKTIQQLIADAMKIRSDDYELAPDSHHGREVHHKGKQVGTVHRINVADENDSHDMWEYLALARHANAKGEIHTRSLGNHQTPEAAFEAIKNSHAKSKYKDSVH